MTQTKLVLKRGQLNGTWSHQLFGHAGDRDLFFLQKFLLEAPKEAPKTVMHKKEQQPQIKLGQISVERWVTKPVVPKDKSSHTT